MATSQHYLGFRITKYDNESTCYVWFYQNMNRTHIDTKEMGFKYASKKFNLSDDNYTSVREDGKIIYTRK